MELLFESRTNLGGMSGHLRFVQRQPTIHPEPVMQPDCYVDRKGFTHYGSVLNDAGKLRLWYLAFTEEFGKRGFGASAAVAYAESTDGGYHFTKPDLGIVPYGPGPNNLTDLGLHSATVFIDPQAPPECRYRATGCGMPSYHLVNPAVTTRGYYTAHSADGLRWQLDQPTPTWSNIDVITSVYHPARQAGLVALKQTPTVMRIARRSIHTAELRTDSQTPALAALYPDDFDDAMAAQRGFHSCDYYGMGMMPAARGTVGFLWKYWHALPYSAGWGNGPQALYGCNDVALVYQSEPGALWQHMPGRPLFISRDALPWPMHWICTSSNVIESGEEHRLYISCRPYPHGYGVDLDWQHTEVGRRPYENVILTFASWPKWQLFGFEAMPEGTLTIRLDDLDTASQVLLNYEVVSPDGFVRAELEYTDPETGQTVQCQPLDSEVLTDKSIGATLSWEGKTTVNPAQQVKLNLTVSHARVYAYDVKTVTG